MRVHFLHHQVLDTVVILEEGNLPHPWSPQCNMMFPWSTLNGRQPVTAQCVRGAEQKRRWLAGAELREITERSFEDYGEPLENVASFKYLGRVMTAEDDDWPAVLGNRQRASKSWGRLSWILARRKRIRRCWEFFLKR